MDEIPILTSDEYIIWNALTSLSGDFYLKPHGPKKYKVMDPLHHSLFVIDRAGLKGLIKNGLIEHGKYEYDGWVWESHQCITVSFPKGKKIRVRYATKR